MYHTQTEILQVVAALVRRNGVAYWEEIYKHIEKTLPLTEEDYGEYVGRDNLRYQVIANNLRCNCAIIDHCHDLINIAGGFAVATYAKLHNIEEDHAPRTARAARQAGVAKADDRRGENAIRSVYLSSFPLLKEYDRKEVYRDFDELTVDEFGIKYNFTKDKDKN